MSDPRDLQHAAMMINAIESTSRLLGLDPEPTYEGRRVLTRDTARQVSNLVGDWMEARGSSRPKLHEPGHEGPMWVLSLEGDYEWPLDVCEALRDRWPDGVFAEPVTGWCLGLYPKD